MRVTMSSNTGCHGIVDRSNLHTKLCQLQSEHHHYVPRPSNNQISTTREPTKQRVDRLCQIACTIAISWTKTTTILTDGKRRRIFQKGILKRPERTDTIVTDYEELEEQLFVGDIGQKNVRVSPRLP